LADIGILTLGEDAHGTLVDAAGLVVVADCGLTVTPCTRTQIVEPVTVTPQSTSPYYGEHRADDAFTPYPAAYAAKRRGVAVDDIARSLSSAALTVAAALDAAPECTAQDIADATGLTPGSVRAALRKLDAAGLIIVWRGRPCRYELHPDHAARLDDIRNKMSGYGRGLDIRRHNALARAAFADYALENAPPQEPRDINRLERYQLRNNARAVALDETLREMGFNPRARVAQRAATTKRETIQTVAQTIGKRKTTHHADHPQRNISGATRHTMSQ
jgi:DNA-binding transcriptional ArsR family regulator